MGPLLSDITDSQLSQMLLALARAAISAAVSGKEAPSLSDLTSRYPDLMAPAACFVTLHKAGRLRGCIGSLTAWRPFLVDLVENAVAAATRDPRFQPVQQAELAAVNIDISLLTPPVQLIVESEQELLQKLKPGIHGLIFEGGGKRATYLPTVWDMLPDPKMFVRELKQKAGLPADYWDSQVVCQVYETVIIAEPDCP